MKNKLWHLPWASPDVPHALVDINRGCNVVCRSCYNIHSKVIKPVEEIKRDFDLLRELRKLHSVSIVGGEPLLHPDLCDIIRYIRSKDVHVELFTNGLLLDDSMAAGLKQAGVEVLFLHIEPGQKRTDLPPDASLEDIYNLISSKAAIAGEAGMEVGIAVTVQEDTTAEMIDLIRFALQHEWITFVLVTLPIDISSIELITGDVLTGLHGKADPGLHREPATGLNNKQLMELVKQELDLTPFAYVGSNIDPADYRWLSYYFGTVRKTGQETIVSLRASMLERLYLKFHRLVTGRYPFFQRQNPLLLRFQLLLNALSGGHLFRNLNLLLKSLRPKTVLRYKKLLFQKTADVGPDGRVIHCRDCPDAVLKNGRLVPVCINDKAE